MTDHDLIEFDEDEREEGQLAIMSEESHQVEESPSATHIAARNNRKKALKGKELIEENIKELQEVISYLDFSFERAFTIQEKEFMLAYKVSFASLVRFLKQPLYFLVPCGRDLSGHQREGQHR